MLVCHVLHKKEHVVYSNLLAWSIAAIVSMFAVVNPAFGVYCLVFDYWFVGRVLDVGGGLTPNIFIFIVTFSSYILKIVTRKTSCCSGVCLNSICLYILVFILYMQISSYIYLDRINFSLFVDFSFFIIIVFLFQNDSSKAFANITCVIAICVCAIIGANWIDRLLQSGTIIANVSNGGRIQPGFHVLLSIPFLVAYIKSSSRTSIIYGMRFVIFFAFVFVLAQVSRTLSVSLFVLILFYVLRKKNLIKSLLIMTSCIVIILFIGTSTDYGKKFLRIDATSSIAQSLKSEDSLRAFSSGRSELYEYSWQLFIKNPVFGIGYDAFRNPNSNDNNFLSLTIQRPAQHSVWIQYLTETGLVGFFMYLMLYLIVYRSCASFLNKGSNVVISNYSEACVAGFILFFLGGIFDNFGPSFRIFYVFCALAVAIKFESSRKIPQVFS